MTQHGTKKILLTLALVAVFSLAKSALALTLTPIRLEISGDKGQTLSEEMTIINERTIEQTYYSSFANFEARGETGAPTLIEARDDLGTWMSAPQSVTLKAGEAKIVHLSVTIPRDAEAGGHFGAVLWGTSPTGAGNGQVSIGAKTAMLVLLRVNGPVSVAGGVIEFATKAHQRVFTSRPVSFYYRFQNSGNDRIKPAGYITVRDTIGLRAGRVLANPIEGNILPQSIRKFETVWQGSDGADLGDTSHEGYFGAVKREWRNFAFGYYRAHMAIAYGTDAETTDAVVSFWVLPWQLLLFITILALIGFFAGRFGMRRYNRWVIGQAHKLMQQHAERERAHSPNV